mgnify:CR=1 FL=1
MGARNASLACCLSHVINTSLYRTVLNYLQLQSQYYAHTLHISCSTLGSAVQHGLAGPLHPQNPSATAHNTWLQHNNASVPLNQQLTATPRFSPVQLFICVNCSMVSTSIQNHIHNHHNMLEQIDSYCPLSSCQKGVQHIHCFTFHLGWPHQRRSAALPRGHPVQKPTGH